MKPLAKKFNINPQCQIAKKVLSLNFITPEIA